MATVYGKVRQISKQIPDLAVGYVWEIYFIKWGKVFKYSDEIVSLCCIKTHTIYDPNGEIIYRFKEETEVRKTKDGIWYEAPLGINPLEDLNADDTEVFDRYYGDLMSDQVNDLLSDCKEDDLWLKL